jgi:hypothetical protein
MRPHWRHEKQQRHADFSVTKARDSRVGRLAFAFRLCACTWIAGGTLSVALAGGTLTPYAAEDVEHNSNIFDLQTNQPTPGYPSGSLADTQFETRAGIDGVYMLDAQRFFATAEFRRYDYDKFTELDHNEYLFDGGLKYQVEQIIDGTFEYRHEQRMVQFQELIDATELIIETENTANASLNVDFTPEWRLESRVRDHLLDSPRSDVPQLSLHEDAIHEGLRYIGVSNLSAGVDVEYLQGQYRHDPLALDPNYHQTSEYLAANYLVSGLTTFNGALGYTSRTDPTNSGTTGAGSGVTGNLGYKHALSGKTTLNLALKREVSTYLTTGGSEIDSTASLGATYQATYKIRLRFSYDYTISKFPDTPIGVDAVERTDHFQTANFEASYQVLHWLSIRPYARYQTRHSNIPLDTFNSNVVGIELLAKKAGTNQ